MKIRLFNENLFLSDFDVMDENEIISKIKIEFDFMNENEVASGNKIER